MNGNAGDSRIAMALTGLLAVLVASCHLLVGMKKEVLPERDVIVDGDEPDLETPCTSNEDCDDDHVCTRDTCNVTTQRCEHVLLSSESECRPPAGLCDEAERCDGETADCPEDRLKPASETCRSASTQCDVAETCTGDSRDCPDDEFADGGRACDDGNPCTHSDACDGRGSCSGTNGLSGVRHIATGFIHACAMLEGGTLRCWGSNASGQLGNGTSSLRETVPTPVSGLPGGETLRSVSCAGSHTCTLFDSGNIACWGYNAWGQLGDGTQESSNVPVEISYEGRVGADEISGGLSHTCAILRPQGVHCWGDNREAQLGIGVYSPPDFSAVPVAVSDLAEIPAAISCGGLHSCVVLAGGEVLCWGKNSSYQLGYSTEPFSRGLSPGRSLLTDAARDVSLGFFFSCALLEEGGVKCWGNNEFGQLGSGTVGGISMDPIEVTGLPAEDPVTAMSSGEKHACALLQSGGVMCWGGNSRGQLGDGTTQDRPSPVEAAGLPLPATEVSCGGEYTCARLENATVHCWGANDEGQLGSGTNDDSLMPVEVVCEAPGI